ncbi:hypothetical protein NP233_g11541 [Leucocoprinus birnbaumii]|uniref:Aminotransferase class V domain-containing protein n=1 Tax=Leucocoprinus birnbaumii TaxID=56174 RepID=A0AAD5VGD3_9AGAR|nr:hypothetical protein NP233_g11541 [Leucocoprinus birnbaumii]
MKSINTEVDLSPYFKPLFMTLEPDFGTRSPPTTRKSTVVDPVDLFRQESPAFGRQLKELFPLDQDYIHLNHGGYGSAPCVVQQAARDLSREIEAQPDKFYKLEFLPRLNGVRERLAKMVKAHPSEIVLIQNNSTGINTVMRNFEWQEDDIIICFSTSFQTVHKTAYSLGDNSPHPTVTQIELLFPTTPQEIVESFRNHVKSLPKMQGKKRVALLDTIISNPGVHIPWKELVKICREEGIWSVVDAAHSIGQEQDLDLTEAAPDFWVSNCHKWLYTKRPLSILYIPERNRNVIKTSLPTSGAYKPIARRSSRDFLAQWEGMNRNGATDWVPYLTAETALDFREWLGGEEKINNYCHQLALDGGKRMAEIFGTRLLDPDGDFTLNMVNVELPFPRDIPGSDQVNDLFMKKMLYERNAYSAHYYHNGRWWTRCSAQVYNEIQDFEKIARIWIEVCNEVKRELEADDKYQ